MGVMDVVIKLELMLLLALLIGARIKKIND